MSNGGVPKRAVPQVHVGTVKLEGDDVNHPKVHGGPERAVCLYSLEKILALQGEGHPIFPGAIGENLTLVGLDWESLKPDMVLSVGDAVVQLSTYTTPCNTISAYFEGTKGFRRVDEKRYPGWSRWYARVLQEGAVRVGDAVRLDA